MNYSVGIPVRNEEKTLEGCINSVLTQTHLPEKIIICVNGSTDNTLDVAKNIAKKEKKIEVITSNPGKPNAWNSIIRKSYSDYVLFLDGDISINRTAAENMTHAFLENSELAVVGGSISYREPKNKTFFSRISVDGWNRTLKNSYLSGSNYMLNINNLFLLAEKKKIQLMPQDIINEDGLIDALVNSESSIKIIRDAYSIITPLLTYSEWVERTYRVLKGQKQILEQYPQLNSRFISEDINKNRFPSYVTRFFEADDILKKVGTTSLWFLRQIMKYEVFKEESEYNNLWTPINSTKIEFD